MPRVTNGGLTKRVHFNLELIITRREEEERETEEGEGETERDGGRREGNFAL